MLGDTVHICNPSMSIERSRADTGESPEAHETVNLVSAVVNNETLPQTS